MSETNGIEDALKFFDEAEEAAKAAGAEKESERLRFAQEQLRLQVETLRRDFSARLAEHDRELEIRARALEESERLARRHEEELEDERKLTKELKRQNLALQHQLNAWGIPVSTGDSDPAAGLEHAHQRFFPRVVPPEPGDDPAPIALRGDLRVFHVMSLLSFIGNSNLTGVLTLVHDDTVTKIFVENATLGLVAWSRRHSPCSLPYLLIESELLAPNEVASYQEENLYDFEIANRLLYEGKLDVETIRECLREHARVILAQLLQLDSGAFFFQRGRPTYDQNLKFRLSITDLLLRSLTMVDEKARDGGGR